jgi:D-lyxose ketol-isomerase
MNRSEVNEILRRSSAFIRSFGYVMPPFADWEPEQMRRATQEAPDIIARRLGWDVTDFGQGRFEDFGLFLFTVRNGNAADLAQGRGMLYAEKIMISRAGQRAPMHRHNIKAEDIINRGGGDLVLELFAPAPDGSIDPHAPVTVPCDGVPRTLPAGGHLRLNPGESVTLLPGVWHAFWGERADVLIGEVSTVNDDLTDNVFRDPVGRFSDIVEDEAPWRLLVADYDQLVSPQQRP